MDPMEDYYWRRIRGGGWGGLYKLSECCDGRTADDHVKANENESIAANTVFLAFRRFQVLALMV